jgi:hypothetical protein
MAMAFDSQMGPDRSSRVKGIEPLTQTISSAVCRQQEAEHRQVAATTLLPNVRTIALAAAAAWAREAEEAEALESGSGPILSDEDAKIAREFLLDEDIDHEDDFNDPGDEPKEVAI